MVGPRYTLAQTRARVAALEIAADHLAEETPLFPEDRPQYEDIIRKLRNEATRLKAKAQERRRNAR